MTTKDRELKRISLFIGEDQYEAINKKSLNLSWLLRDLIDDYLSHKKIVMTVSDETMDLYQKVIVGTGALEDEFEPFFREALAAFLKSRIESMRELEKLVTKKDKRR